MIIVWTLCAFVCGSLMFSYWLGRIVRTNLKAVGDGNPGALNLWKAAGFRWGIMGIVLDFLKGYLILVLLLGSSRIEGYAMIPVALAPIVGHAFSPFLRGRGGKAIAVTFGVWSALSGFEVSLALAIYIRCHKAYQQRQVHIVGFRWHAGCHWLAACWHLFACKGIQRRGHLGMGW
ncbi:glycerol-3-phosphate acyltransferase [Paenibacillus alba]|uniref:Glycerol-3-phosphate acyltransferase n=1 Tax=Paenibacillus alba TaxID=1197127 RepID=A0ABU6G9C9_9BACL|nr:glycerol-3-phosphate acyltransferase [Paenibacillus alba]MEC0229423.1 glycerol-3-phosphate acyltransferase [Paenibacillus alba]